MSRFKISTAKITNYGEIEIFKSLPINEFALVADENAVLDSEYTLHVYEDENLIYDFSNNLIVNDEERAIKFYKDNNSELVAGVYDFVMKNVNQNISPAYFMFTGKFIIRS